MRIGDKAAVRSDAVPANAALGRAVLCAVIIGCARGIDLGAIVFSLFVLIGNPLIVLLIMGALGYRKRTGFLAGLTVAQISEFSLIFIAMGVSLGHVREDALGLVTMVGLVTIAASTYMITCSIPDDHIAPRRSALFMARWVVTEARDGRATC